MRAGRGISPSLTRGSHPPSSQGDTANALEQFRQGRAIIVQVLEKSPDNAQLPKDLAGFDAAIANLVHVSPRLAARAGPALNKALSKAFELTTRSTRNRTAEFPNREFGTDTVPSFSRIRSPTARLHRLYRA